VARKKERNRSRNKITLGWGNFTPAPVERAEVLPKAPARVAFFLSSGDFPRKQYEVLPEGVKELESQFSFVVLNFHYQIDNWDAIIGVPLLLYSYPQEVGGTSVDVGEGVIREYSEKVKEGVRGILQKVEGTEFLGQAPYKVSVSYLNSFHYHPRGMRSFSGSDLDADLNFPGVCYPYGKGEFKEVIHWTGLAGIQTCEPYRMDCYGVEGKGLPQYTPIEAYWVVVGDWEIPPTFFREGTRRVVGGTLRESVVEELWAFWGRLNLPRELYIGEPEFFKTRPLSLHHGRFSPWWGKGKGIREGEITPVPPLEEEPRVTLNLESDPEDFHPEDSHPEDKNPSSSHLNPFPREK
jgi:hypothetical protein